MKEGSQIGGHDFRSRALVTTTGFVDPPYKTGCRLPIIHFHGVKKTPDDARNLVGQCLRIFYSLFLRL
jgi:hypothetical protein